jgi:hypothetical protein
MADAEEEERLPRLEIEDKMRKLADQMRQHLLCHQELVLRHQEWQAQLQAQAQVDLAEEAECLEIVRMFEEAGYVKRRGWQ